MRWPFMFKKWHEVLLGIEHAKARELAMENTAMKLDIRRMTSIISSQQATIAKMQSELNILTGAMRVKVEADRSVVIEQQPDLQPDVIVHDEDERGRRMQSEVHNIAELEREFNETLNRLAEEVDTSKITPAAMSEALVTSPEDWRAQHNEPPEELPLSAASS